MKHFLLANILMWAVTVAHAQDQEQGVDPRPNGCNLTWQSKFGVDQHILALFEFGERVAFDLNGTTHYAGCEERSGLMACAILKKDVPLFLEGLNEAVAFSMGYNINITDERVMFGSSYWALADKKLYVVGCHWNYPQKSK